MPRAIYRQDEQGERKSIQNLTYPFQCLQTCKYSLECTNRKTLNYSTTDALEEKVTLKKTRHMLLL